MSTLNIPTLGAFRGPIVDKSGMANRDFVKLMQEWSIQLANAITLIGELKASTVIEGRTEGIGTTVGNIDSVGDFDADAVIDGAVNGITNFNQRTGGGRGFNALDTNNRLADSFRNTAVNVSVAPTGAANLSNDGAATLVTVGAETKQFGAGQVSYNAGSFDPGVFGTFYAYADDPTFAGGTVTYLFSTSAFDQTAAEGRIPFGAITTTGGTPQTGGGDDGGSTPGSESGRGMIFV